MELELTRSWIDSSWVVGVGLTWNPFLHLTGFPFLHVDSIPDRRNGEIRGVEHGTEDRTRNSGCGERGHCRILSGVTRYNMYIITFWPHAASTSSCTLPIPEEFPEIYTLIGVYMYLNEIHSTRFYTFYALGMEYYTM